MSGESGRRTAIRVAIAAAALIAAVILVPVGLVGAGLYKTFYLPAGAMEPTLLKGDRR